MSLRLKKIGSSNCEILEPQFHYLSPTLWSLENLLASPVVIEPLIIWDPHWGPGQKCASGKTL